MFLWVFSNSCLLNLLLVQIHQAKIIIVNRFIQGRNNITRVLVELISCNQRHRGGDSPVVENRTSDPKVAGFWFDSRTSNASLCLWERYFTLISYWSQAVYPLWWSSLTKNLQTEPQKVLCVGMVRQAQGARFIHTNE